VSTFHRSLTWLVALFQCNSLERGVGELNTSPRSSEPESNKVIRYLGQVPPYECYLRTCVDTKYVDDSRHHADGAVA
jgi:hypothetical protein